MSPLRELTVLALPAGPFQTNCLIIHDRNQATIVDPGMGAAELVRRAIGELGLTVEQIVLTHGHIDHIRDLPEVQQEYGVPTHMHPADLPWLSRETLDGMGPLGEMHNTGTMGTPETPAPVADGDQLTIAGVEFTAHHMPGHSPGSVMFRGVHAGGAVILGGDVLFAGGVGRTDLPLSDPEAMMDSLRRIPQVFQDADTVFPGHGSTTTVGAEKRQNPFLQGVD